MDLIDSLTKDLFGIFIKKKNKFQQTFITPEEAQAEGIHLFVLKIKYNINILLKVAIKYN